MNILFTYIRKYLVSNKLSTLITIFSISCASAMFFIVTCLGINSMMSLYDSSINTYGNYHTVYTNVSDDFIDSLNLHTKIEKVNTIEFKEKANTSLIHGVDKDSLFLLGVNDKTFHDLKFSLSEGRLPTNKNEVVVSNNLINHTTQEIDLNKSIDFNGKNYKIVGIVSQIFLEDNNDYFTLLSFSENIGTKNAYVRYTNRNETYVNTNNISMYFNNEFEDSKINHHVVLNNLDSTSTTIVLLSIVGFMTFIFMNILLIINCYKNSYANREKHLAILKIIGVTQSQCKTMIMYEGILLLGVSLVIGLLGAWFTYDLLVQFINYLLSNISVNFFVISSNYKVILLLVTIFYVSFISYISIRYSTNKIISQTVTLTLQSSDEVIVMDSPYLELDKDTNILIRLFKKNIRQNKRSYSPLVTGITTIITIFIFVNSMMGYLREDILMNSYDQNYDCEVIIKNDSYPTELMTQLENIAEESNVVISEKMELTTNELNKFNPTYLDLIVYDKDISIDVLSFDDEIIKEFYSNFDSAIYDGIIINETYSLSHKRYYDILKKYDLSLYYDNKCITEALNLYSTDLLITGTQYSKKPQIILSNDLFNELFNKTNQNHEYHIYYESNDSNSLVKELNKLNYDEVIDYSIHNIHANVKSGKIIGTLIRLILYGFVLLLSLMGFLTLSCVTTINFDYRKNEFMLYRIIGLRTVEMMQIIFLELCYYGTKLLIYSWLLSQSLNYLVYILYFKHIGLKFFIPNNSIIGSIILFIITLVFFMNYIHYRMSKQKYTQVLKNEISLM